MLVAALLITLVVAAATAVANDNQIGRNNESCLPWMHWSKDKKECECGVSLGGKITCEKNGLEVRLQTCLCMIYDNSTETVEVGYCPYACISNWRRENVVTQDR